MQGKLVRTGHQPQGATIGADGIKVEDKFDPVTVFGGVDEMIEMPGGITDVAVGVGVGNEGIFAVELRGNRPETLVLRQAGIEGGSRPQLRCPVSLRAIEGAVRVSQIKAFLEFFTEVLHLVGGEELAQDDKAEGLEVLVLFVAEHRASLIGVCVTRKIPICCATAITGRKIDFGGHRFCRTGIDKDLQVAAQIAAISKTTTADNQSPTSLVPP